jgi:hypothetical protein
MAQAALLASVGTVVFGLLILVRRFRGQEVPVGPIAAHAAVALAGVILWWLYAGGEEQRGQSIGALVGAFTLLLGAILGVGMFAALRGAFGSERRPARGAFARGAILLHGVGALVTLVLVCIELPDAWRRYSGNAPTVEPKADTSAILLLPAWVAAGLVVSVVGHLMLRSRSASSSLSPARDAIVGAAAGTVGGLIGYYAATLSAPISVLAAGLAAVFVWWWRLISFAGLDVDENEIASGEEEFGAQRSRAHDGVR